MFSLVAAMPGLQAFPSLTTSRRTPSMVATALPEAAQASSVSSWYDAGVRLSGKVVPVETAPSKVEQLKGEGAAAIQARAEVLTTAPSDSAPTTPRAFLSSRTPPFPSLRALPYTPAPPPHPPKRSLLGWRQL